jgi:hypothetical protein
MPMRAGDLLEHEGKKYLVRVLRRKERVARIISAADQEKEIPLDAYKTGLCVFITNIPESWPMVAAGSKRNAGPFVSIRRSLNLMEQIDLAKFDDWAPVDPCREGGPIFFSPTLRLRPGEVLTGVHKSGFLSRIDIPTSFGTISARKDAVAKKVRKSERDAFDILSEDEDDF